MFASPLDPSAYFDWFTNNKNLCFPKNPPLGLIRELRFRWAISQPPHFSDLASRFFQLGVVDARQSARPFRSRFCNQFEE